MSEKTYAEIHDNGKDMAANLLSMKDLQIKKWQQATMITSLIALLAVGGMTYTATRATFIPYLVGVDEQTGYVNSLGSLKEVNVEPTDAAINYFLSRFVEEVRAIPADKNVLNQNVSRAVRFLTPESANKFKSLYLPEFTQKVGTGFNRVEILSVTPVSGSKNTYQVRWKETFSQGGAKEVTKNFTSTFNLEKQDVEDKEVLQYNPLGLFIKDFSISEEKGDQK